MQLTAIAIALMALAFTIGSFWWLYARRGSIVACQPHTYAFADGTGNGARIRLPLAFFNSGATALIVQDLRLLLLDDPAHEAVPWQTTRASVRPESNDIVDFATPFAVNGRQVKELTVEFGDPDFDWFPEPSSTHRLRVEALVHPSQQWTEVVTFGWIAPQDASVMSSYITHRT